MEILKEFEVGSDGKKIVVVKMIPKNALLIVFHDSFSLQRAAKINFKDFCELVEKVTEINEKINDVMQNITPPQFIAFQTKKFEIYLEADAIVISDYSVDLNASCYTLEEGMDLLRKIVLVHDLFLQWIDEEKSF